MTWEKFTSLPSRKSAELPNREERAQILAEVSSKGFIDNYSGVRISHTGKRFRIERATVWNLRDRGGNYKVKRQCLLTGTIYSLLFTFT